VWKAQIFLTEMSDHSAGISRDGAALRGGVFHGSGRGGNRADEENATVSSGKYRLRWERHGAEQIRQRADNAAAIGPTRCPRAESERCRCSGRWSLSLKNQEFGQHD
jgi:hypothetical protein